METQANKLRDKEDYYVVRLTDLSQEQWTYSDSYSRPVRFPSKKDAEKKIKELFRLEYPISVAVILHVTEEEVGIFTHGTIQN